ncbi:MAG: hypothetical protein JXQ91_07500 [Vannielia sp.]|uniref:hypothetical protein n=1 Tax=Vannielia sp. TaxID=2813045 RepID=UPI003B8B9364
MGMTENSVRDIASKVGLPPATVHRFMRGENVSLETAMKMLPVRQVCPCCGQNTRTPDPAQAELLAEAVEVITGFMTGGCYLCAGDCASANPPVASCPMAHARATLDKIRGNL